MVVSWNRGTPSHHQFKMVTFPKINQPFLGIPISGNPLISPYIPLYPLISPYIRLYPHYIPLYYHNPIISHDISIISHDITIVPLYPYYIPIISHDISRLYPTNASTFELHRRLPAQPCGGSSWWLPRAWNGAAGRHFSCRNHRKIHEVKKTWDNNGNMMG